jgi:glycosyltransferase involved in cell wall biosynthesis
MRALFLIRSFTIGGAERQLAVLLPRLHKYGVEPIAAVFYPGGAFEGELTASGVQVVSLEKTGRWDVARFFARWVSTVRALKPDVVVGWMPVENLFVSAATCLAQDVRTVWSLRGSEIDPAACDWSIRTAFGLEKALIRWPNSVLANSRAGLRSKGLTEAPPRHAVIENGVDTTRFAPDAAARSAIRAQLGVAASASLIGIVGRLAPQKDHRTFLEAAARVQQQSASARFLVLGDGPEPYRKQLQEYAASLGLRDAVLWMNATPEVAAVLNALDLAVSTSSFGEGTHNVLIEAMSLGLPVVSTDIGDARRVVAEFGSVVEPRRADAVAAAILTELAADDESKRARRRARIDADYGVERYVRRMADHLRAVVSYRR